MARLSSVSTLCGHGTPFAHARDGKDTAGTSHGHRLRRYSAELCGANHLNTYGSRQGLLFALLSASRSVLLSQLDRFRQLLPSGVVTERWIRELSAHDVHYPSEPHFFKTHPFEPHILKTQLSESHLFRPQPRYPSRRPSANEWSAHRYAHPPSCCETRPVRGRPGLIAVSIREVHALAYDGPTSPKSDHVSAHWKVHLMSRMSPRMVIRLM